MQKKSLQDVPLHIFCALVSFHPVVFVLVATVTFIFPNWCINEKDQRSLKEFILLDKSSVIIGYRMKETKFVVCARKKQTKTDSLLMMPLEKLYELITSGLAWRS